MPSSNSKIRTPGPVSSQSYGCGVTRRDLPNTRCSISAPRLQMWRRFANIAAIKKREWAWTSPNLHTLLNRRPASFVAARPAAAQGPTSVVFSTLTPSQPLLFFCIATFLSTTSVLAGGHSARNGNVHSAVDVQLERALDSFFQGKPDSALKDLDQLVARHPNFRLAHLVRGDVLLARAKPISTFGNAGDTARERLEELRAEAKARFRSHKETAVADKVPRYFLQLSAAQRHAILVDATSSRVYIYQNANGQPRLIADYYSTLGRHGFDKEREGDKKTPLGVYHITSKIPGKQLPDLYGWGAFPINYPNEWDRRVGRTGSGIWLHGVPAENYARAPRASDGCVALANPDIEELSQRVQIGVTPVIIAERIEWVTPEVSRTETDAFMQALEAWRASWESRDTARYLSYYAKDFQSDGMDRPAWASYKQRVNAAKTFINVSLSNVSVFRNPGKQPLMVVSFDQDYRSSALSEQSKKRQYWVLENGSWKIAYEAQLRDSQLNLPDSFRSAQRGPRIIATAQQTGAKRK